MGMLSRYVRSFIDFAGRSGLVAFVVVFVGALLEGIGLLAILPILELLVGGAAGGSGSRIESGLVAIGLVGHREQVIAVLLGFLALVAIRGVVSTIRARQLAAISQGFVDHWRLRIFERMHRADWPTLAKMHRHEALHAITNDVNRLAGGTQQILTGATTTIMVMVQIVVAAIISPILTLLALGGIAVCAGAAMPFFLSSARRHGERQTGFGRRMQDTLNRFLTGLKLAKIHGYHGYLEDLEASTTKLRRDAIRFSEVQAGLTALLQFAIAALICLLIGVGLFVANIPYANLIAFVVILVRLSGPIMQMVESARSMANLLPAFAHLERLKNSLIQQQESSSVNPVEASPGGAVGFAFDSVSFAHQEGARPILQNVELDVPRGALVALTGRSGVGKTTLLDLLAGLLTPSRGVIRIDGDPLDDPRIRARLRHSIAYAPQDPALFDCSLRENLGWGLAQIDDESIWEALELARADRIVRDLPEGLASRVGEGGTLLSGGERQRICLAAMLLRKPGLLILDEALSAIDRQAEAAILMNISALKGRMTIVLVTHRAFDAAEFDQIWHLDEHGVVTVDRR